MSKYVIELGENAKAIQSISITSLGNVYTDSWYVENLEELNSDYINEHFGELQDTAYQRGLDDAWDAARKIIHMPEGKLLNIFTECYSAVCTALQVLLKYDASEAIEKLKAYEEKQKADGEIKVGDEVIYNGTTKCIVVRPENDERYASLIDGDGIHHSADHRECKKTGRHFDIGKILEDMRHD